MTVVNKRTHTPTSNDVYIGRGSMWGNPFRIGRDGERDDVIRMYTAMMVRRLEGTDADGWLHDLAKLKGKTLVCYCAPLACHGDVLEQLIEEMNNA